LRSRRRPLLPLDGANGATQLRPVKRRLLARRVWPALAAVQSAAASAAIVLAMSQPVVRWSGIPPRPTARVAVAELPDSPWGSAWEASARSPTHLAGESLALLAAGVGRAALAALALCALALVLHTCVRVLAQWRSLLVRRALGARMRELLRLVATPLARSAAAGALVGSAAGIAGGAAFISVAPGILSRPALWPAAAAVPVALAGAVALVTAAAALMLVRLHAGAGVTRLHGDHVSASRGMLAFQGMLVVLQLAGLMVVAQVAALIVRDVRPAGAVVLPWDTSLVSVRIAWEGSRAGSQRARAAALGELSHRLDAAGIGAAVASPDAWIGLGKDYTAVSICASCFEGQGFKPFSSARVRMVAVAPGSLARMGLEIRSGREFTASDTLGAAPVALVNRIAASRLFPQGNPLRERIATGLEEERMYRVVGVVPDITPGGLGSGGGPVPIVYLPALQHPPLVAETTLRAEQEPRLREVIGAWGGGASGIRPVLGERATIAERLALLRRPVDWFAALAASGAVLALLVGLHSFSAMMSQVVTARRREIATRMALGAGPVRIELWLVRSAVVLSCGGILLGVSIARWVGWLMREEVRRSSEGDVAVLLLVAAGTLVAGVFACLLPARRATRVEPSAVWSTTPG
jgi:hypothetical protein